MKEKYINVSGRIQFFFWKQNILFYFYISFICFHNEKEFFAKNEQRYVVRLSCVDTRQLVFYRKVVVALYLVCHTVNSARGGG